MFNGFSIILCRCGTCSVRISGRDYEAVPGSLLILSPDQLVEVFSVSPDFSPRSILVSLDVILEFPSPVDINIVNTALRNPLYSLPPEKTAHLLEYYDFLEKQYREIDNAYREEISKTLFYALMLEICDIIRSDTGDSTAVSKPRQEKLTDDFFKLMARYYKTEHNVAFYADRLNRTPKYLSGAIKKLSGRSVSDWINSSLLAYHVGVRHGNDSFLFQVHHLEFLQHGRVSALSDTVCRSLVSGYHMSRIFIRRHVIVSESRVIRPYRKPQALLSGFRKIRHDAILSCCVCKTLFPKIRHAVRHRFHRTDRT